MSLSAIGYFAYNFNIFASKSTNNPWYLGEYPILVPVFLCIAGYLSILACRLLLMTVDLHYSEQRGQELIPQDHSKREGVLNLPSLLNLSAPKTNLGTFLYVAFLMMALTMLFRFSLYWSIELEKDLDEYITSNWLNNAVFVVLLLVCAVNFYWLQYFQVLCVLCYILLPCDTSEPKPSLGWLERAPILFAMFVQLFANQLNVMSVAAAAPELTPRQDVFLKCAVGLIIADYLLIGLLVPDGIDISKGSWKEIVFQVVFVLCDVSSVHIRVRTLTDVLVAWRYGHRSHEVPRLPSQIMPFAIVVLLIFLVFLIKDIIPSLKDVLLEPHSFLLVSSMMLILITYCYHYTVERMMGQAEFKVAPQWWSYALCVGGVFSLMGYLSYFFLPNPENMIYAIFIDLVLATLLLLWHLLRR